MELNNLCLSLYKNIQAYWGKHHSHECYTVTDIQQNTLPTTPWWTVIVSIQYALIYIYIYIYIYMGEPLGCISSALSETSFCIYNVCIQNIHRAESLVTANTMNSRKIFLVIVNLWGKLDQCVWKDQYVMQLISGNLEIREHLCNDEKLWPYCWLMILTLNVRGPS